MDAFSWSPLLTTSFICSKGSPELPASVITRKRCPAVAGSVDGMKQFQPPRREVLAAKTQFRFHETQCTLMKLKAL